MSWRIFQFVVIHIVKGFGVVNKTEVDIFLELSCFLMIQWMLAIWSLVPLPFLNPAWTSGSSWFRYCWSLAWRIFEHYFTSMWDECGCAVVWAFFGTAFLWDWNENWPFPASSNPKSYFSNPKRWCCESAALNMPANLENSALATGLEKEK